MKSRSEIWLSALEDLGALCSVSTARDAKTALRRFEHEGDSFFTVTLPQMARDLEEALSLGAIPSRLFEGWARSNMCVHIDREGKHVGKIRQLTGAGTPKFLGGFYEIVFNTDLEMTSELYSCYENARVRPLPLMRQTDDEADIAEMASAIHAIRQLCSMFGKEKELCSDSAVQEAIDRYVTLDRRLIDPLPTSGPTSFSKVDGSL